MCCPRRNLRGAGCVLDRTGRTRTAPVACRADHPACSQRRQAVCPRQDGLSPQPHIELYTTRLDADRGGHPVNPRPCAPRSRCQPPHGCFEAASCAGGATAGWRKTLNKRAPSAALGAKNGESTRLGRNSITTWKRPWCRSIGHSTRNVCSPVRATAPRPRSRMRPQGPGSSIWLPARLAPLSVNEAPAAAAGPAS